jgi:hypothetical protein
MKHSRGTRPPKLVIEVEFEEAPRVHTDAANEREHSLLCLWISTQPDLSELLDLAIESREAWRRRAEVA